MDSRICIDASLALKLVLSEPGSDQEEVEWEHWVSSGAEIGAPYLFIYETSSVLRNRVYRKELTHSEADEALNLLGA